MHGNNITRTTGRERTALKNLTNTNVAGGGPHRSKQGAMQPGEHEGRDLTETESKRLRQLRLATQIYTETYALAGWCSTMREAIINNLQENPEDISPAMMRAWCMAPVTLSVDLAAKQAAVCSLLREVHESEPPTANGSTLSARYATAMNSYRLALREVGQLVRLPADETNQELQVFLCAEAEEIFRAAQSDRVLCDDIMRCWRNDGFSGDYANHRERQSWARSHTAAGNISPTSLSDAAYRPSDREWEMTEEEVVEWQLCDLCGETEIGKQLNISKCTRCHQAEYENTL